MSNLLAAIRAREASIPGVRTEVIGTITVSPARFERVELLITADCRDRELFEHLVEIADRACIMMIPFAGSSTFKFGLVGPSEFPKLSV